MDSGIEAIDQALSEVKDARSRVLKSSAPQVRNADENAFLRSVAYAWFYSHRPIVEPRVAGVAPLTDVDTHYRTVLNATEKYSARTTYADAFKAAKEALVGLRAAAVTAPPPMAINEAPPDFSPLAADQTMKDILVRRWAECQRCITADANLAATVMMGGLLEALFVARANKLADKSPLFKCKGTPMDPKTRKTLALKEWTLRAYIDVAGELRWITSSGKDVAAVLRDYRNYVHPEKERSHGVVLTADDSAMFWDVTKRLAKQLLT